MAELRVPSERDIDALIAVKDEATAAWSATFCTDGPLGQFSHVALAGGAFL